jgi:hypothetical protein
MARPSKSGGPSGAILAVYPSRLASLAPQDDGVKNSLGLRLIDQSRIERVGYFGAAAQRQNDSRGAGRDLVAFLVA